MTAHEERIAELLAKAERGGRGHRLAALREARRLMKDAGLWEERDWRWQWAMRAAGAHHG